MTTNIDACLDDEAAARVNKIKAYAEAELVRYPGSVICQDILWLIAKLDRALGDVEAASYRES